MHCTGWNECGKSIKPYLSLADIEVHLRQACQPLQLPLGIRIHHSHDITRLPSGGQSCRLCGAVVRRNTKRLQVPCRKLAVANRHGQVLGRKKNIWHLNRWKIKCKDSQQLTPKPARLSFLSCGESTRNARERWLVLLQSFMPRICPRYPPQSSPSSSMFNRCKFFQYLFPSGFEHRHFCIHAFDLHWCVYLHLFWSIWIYPNRFPSPGWRGTFCLKEDGNPSGVSSLQSGQLLGFLVGVLRLRTKSPVSICKDEDLNAILAISCTICLLRLISLMSAKFK